MQIRELNVESAIVNLEYQVSMLTQLLNFILEKNGESIIVPNNKQVAEYKAIAITEIRKKYPSMNIQTD